MTTATTPPLMTEFSNPTRLSEDPDRARQLLELVPQVPTPVWGRDELGAGEMWNSNSLISWLIARSGLDVESIQPPLGGRAPGWRAGVVIARREQAEAGHPVTEDSHPMSASARLRGGQ
jgi:hypothetical protein